MALITCPECGKQISSFAPMCPNCGYPIASMNSNSATEKVGPKSSAQQSKYKYSQCKPSEYENKKNKFKYSGSATAITIPDVVTYISDKSFKKVKAIFLGKNVETVHRAEVEWFDVSEDNPFFSSVDGVLFNKDKTELVRYPVMLDSKEYKVPNYCVTIKKEAFYGAKKLESVILHDKLNIESWAFYKAQKLKTIKWASNQYPDNTWPLGVPLNDLAFCDAGITSIVFPDGITEITSAFSGCPITEVVVPQSVKKLTIGHIDNLREIIIPEITIPDSVEELGEYAFHRFTKLTSVVIPNSVKTIGKGCFSGCNSLQHVTLPDGIECIPYSCFFGCEELKSITLPSSIKRIEKYAFAAGPKFKELDLPYGIETIEEDAFSSYSVDTIRVPDTVTEYGNIFRISNVIISEAAVNKMDADARKKKDEEDRRKAKEAALRDSIQESLARIDDHLAALKGSLENGEFFAYQKNVKRLLTKREDNKTRLQSLLAARNLAAYNDLVLETNEISKTPIYVYNECGKTVKLYNRNGVDATFAVEVDGVVHAVNPGKYELRDVTARAGTDASQLDKAIMTGIAGGPLLGFLATSFAQTYNTIDVSCSFVHKETGERVRIIFGDNYKVHSSKFQGIMNQIQQFYSLVAQLCENVPPDEMVASKYYGLTLEEMYSDFKKLTSK